MAHGAEHGGGGEHKAASHGSGNVKTPVTELIAGMADLLWDSGGGAVAEALENAPQDILTLKSKGGKSSH